MDSNVEWDIFPKSDLITAEHCHPPWDEKDPLQTYLPGLYLPRISHGNENKARMLAEALFCPELQENAGQSDQTGWEAPRMMFQRVPLGCMWGRQTEFWGSGNSDCFGAALSGPWVPFKENACPRPSHLTVCLALGVVLGQISSKQEFPGRMWVQSKGNQLEHCFAR